MYFCERGSPYNHILHRCAAQLTLQESNRNAISYCQTSSVRISCTAGSANLRRRAGRAWLTFILRGGIKAGKQHPFESDIMWLWPSSSQSCWPRVGGALALEKLQDASSLLTPWALLLSLTWTQNWHEMWMISSSIFRPGEVNVLMGLCDRHIL